MSSPLEARDAEIRELQARVNALEAEREHWHQSPGGVASPASSLRSGAPAEFFGPAVSSANFELLAAATRPEPRHETDTHTLQTRHGAAPGVDFGNPNLFEGSVVLNFEADSPRHRRQVARLGENVEALRERLQRLVNRAREYCAAGNEYARIGRLFAAELVELQFYNAGVAAGNGSAGSRNAAAGSAKGAVRVGGLGPALAELGRTIEEVQSYREALLHSLETTFCAPMEAFVKREVREVRRLKTEACRAREEHEQNVAKLLQLRNDADEATMQQRLDAAAASFKRHELARFDLVHELNQLEMKKKFQMVERVCNGLYADLGFFHQCHIVMATVEPSMRELHLGLQVARKKFAGTDRIWLAKRKQLELRLDLRDTKGGVIDMRDGIVTEMRRTRMSVRDRGLSECERPSYTLPPSFALSPPPGAAPPLALSPSTPPPRHPHSKHRSGASPGGLQRTPLSLVDVSPSARPETSPGSSSSFFPSGPSVLSSPSPAPSPLFPSRHRRSHTTDNFKVDMHEAFAPNLRSPGVPDYDVSHPPSPVPQMLRKHTSFLSHGDFAVLESSSPGVFPSHQSSSRFEFRPSSPLSPTASGFVVKAGFLWKRSSSVRKDWKRRWFTLSGSRLCYERVDGVGPATQVSDVMLCHVREREKRHETVFTFEIISPGRRTLVLQAEHAEDRAGWIAALRTQTELLLVASDQGDAAPRATGRPDLATVGRLMSSNPACVDCGAARPDWCSINLGVLMCIECSGVHRALGAHISKVRSLTLDKLPADSLRVLGDLGNARVNAIYEATGIAEQTLCPDASREARELFIRAKYEDRRYVAPPEGDPQENLHAQAAAGDMEGVLRALVQGAEVNGPLGPERDAAVHAAARAGRPGVLELLWQNGANLEVLNAGDEAPLDLATRGEHGAAISILLQKIEAN